MTTHHYCPVRNLWSDHPVRLLLVRVITEPLFEAHACAHYTPSTVTHSWPILSILFHFYPHNHLGYFEAKSKIQSLGLFYFFTFRERKGGRKWGRETSVFERHMLPLTRPPTGHLARNPGHALTGNWISNLSVHALALSPLHLTSQGRKKFFKLICSYQYPKKVHTFVDLNLESLLIYSLYLLLFLFFLAVLCWRNWVIRPEEFPGFWI